jgi:predicted hydrocarbon binding protein
MNASALLVSNHCVSIGRRALHQLRASLERDTGPQTAAYLQEAGFAAGEELYNAFVAWLKQAYGLDQPANLDVKHLGGILTKFFQESGWGSLSVTSLGPAIVALDSTDWSEADPTAGAQYPSCHLSSGLLADFLGRVTNAQVGVMEVECLSSGAPRCRFLAGSPETLETLYSRMSQGMSYGEAMGVE